MGPRASACCLTSNAVAAGTCRPRGISSGCGIMDVGLSSGGLAAVCIVTHQLGKPPDAPVRLLLLLLLLLV
jgi:hypothetical protein